MSTNSEKYAAAAEKWRGMTDDEKKDLRKRLVNFPRKRK